MVLPNFDLMNMLGKIAQGLQEPGRRSREEIGNALHFAQLVGDAGEPGFQQGVSNFAAPAMRAMNPTMQMVPDEAFQFGAEMAVDPLNLVGAGLPGKAAGALAGKAPQAVIKALEVADKLDKGVIDLSQAALAAPFKGAAWGLNNLPMGPFNKTVFEMVEGVPQAKPQPAATLGEYMFSLSKNGAVKQYVRNLVHMVETLKAKGHSLEGDTIDVTQGPRRAPAGVKLADAARDAEQDFFTNAHQITDPRGQVAALKIINETEQGLMTFSEEIAQQLQANPGNRQQILGQAAEGIITMFSAADDTLEAILGNAQFHQPLDPAIAAQISTEYQKALRTFAADRKTFQHKPAANPDEMFRNWHERVMGFKNPTTGNWNATSSVATQHAAERAAAMLEAAGMGIPVNMNDPVLMQAVTKHVGRIGDVFRNRMAARDMQMVNPLGTVLADLPKELHGAARHAWPEFQNEMKRVTGLRAQMDSILGELSQNLGQGYQPLQVKFAGNRGEMLQHMNQTLQNLGLPAVKDTPELLRVISGKISDTSVGKLQAAIQKFPEGDILLDDPYTMVIDAIGRRKADRLGVDRAAWKRILGDEIGAFKEEQLLTPTYLITNSVGGLLMGSMEGVNPSRVARSLYTNIGRMFKDKEVVLELPDKVFSGIGKPMPASAKSPVSMADINAMQELSKQGLTVLQRRGALAGGARNAVVGGTSGAILSGTDASPEERAKNVAIGAVGGGAWGAAMPTVSKYWLTRLGAGMESVMRQEAATTGTVRHISENLPAALAKIQAEMSTAVGRLAVDPDSRAVSSVSKAVDPTKQAAIVQFIQDQGGIVSKDLLERLLIEEAGILPGRARAIALDYDHMLDEAVSAGENLSHKIHFDYEKLNNTEQVVRNLFVFSTWATKAFPFFARHMVEHPIIGLSILKLSDALNEEQKEKNLSNRFTGTTEVPWASTLWSAVLGHPVKSYYNPGRGFVPFSDTGRMLSSAAMEDDPGKQLANVASGFGLSPNPLIGLLGRMIPTPGINMTDDPSQGYSRISGPMQGVTSMLGVNRGRGINMNAGPQAAETALREVLPWREGRQVPDLDEIAILKRIDELALRNTGQTIASGDAGVGDYVRSKVDKRGPIWDQAAAEIGKERGVRGLAGFGTQFINPQAFLTPEEEQIRGARSERIVPPEVSEIVREASKSNPTQPMPPEVVQAVYEAAIKVSPAGPDGQPKVPDSVVRRLHSGTAADLAWITQQIYIEETNRNPLIEGYKGSGSPEQMQLGNLLELQGNPAALMANDPTMTPQRLAELEQIMGSFERMPQARRALGQNHPIVKEAGKVGTAKDNLREQQPMLKAYMQYLAERKGTGNMDDFLKSYTGPR